MLVALGVWIGNARGQSLWVEHGTVEQWMREGDRWQLNASEAGTASLILLREGPMTDSTGCTFRVRWNQGFSGSSANFTRLHWLVDSTAWSTSPMATIPADDWSILEEHGPLTFMHVGETGTNDSIRWFSPSVSGSWDSTVSLLNWAHLPASFDVELTWTQRPGSDSVQITIAHVFEDERRSALELAACASHEVPVAIGFSAHFTASNTDAAAFEIVEYGPYLPDTVAPALHRARWEPGYGLQLAFSEPMNPDAGMVLEGPEQDSLPLLWLNPPSRRGIALPAHVPERTLQFRLTGFEDFSGQPLPDTLVNVYAVKPHAEAGDVVITECLIASPAQGEWIEIFNGIDRAVDVNRLFIWDGSTNANKAIVPEFGWDGLLAPGERAVLANQWSPWMADWGTFLFAAIEPSMTLSNTGETIGLHSNTGATIDEVTYSNDWWLPNETIGLQKKHPLGCTLADNWISIGDASATSPGIRSPLEWPTDTAAPLIAVSARALSMGEGMFELNQPIHPDCAPAIKGGWAWQNAHQPKALFWRVDSLTENTTWHIAAAEVQGCFSTRPSTLKATLDVGGFPEDGDLIITEIAHDPKGTSATWGMFVELFNPSESEVVEPAGCSLNGTPLNALQPLPPRGRVCIPITLNRASGNVALKNHSGEEIDAAAYSRCWHPDRNQSEAGFSLVRLEPGAGRVHPSAWWAWTSSAHATTGCSPGIPDEAESEELSPPTAAAIACGERNGERFIAFSAPIELEPPWIPLDSFYTPSMAWTQPTGVLAPFAALCPTTDAELNDTTVSLNEVQRRVAGSAEPFIELANSSPHWASTEGIVWTTASIPFPEDWESVSGDTRWFVPPQTPLAFAACPSRIAAGKERVLPAELPSLWGSVELQLAAGGEILDAFTFESDMEAPWHTGHHSIEKTTLHARNADANWKTTGAAAGQTAGSWNSWQTQPEWGLHDDVLHVIHSTGYAAPTGEVAPVAFQINAPDEEAWEVHWTIENNIGASVASNVEVPALVQGDQPLLCQWDGIRGSTYAAIGPYLLKVVLQSVQSHRLVRAQAPIYVCPH